MSRPTRIAVVAAVAAALVAAALTAGATTWMRGQPAASLEPSAVDVGFAQDMSIHHDQAVLMAGIARERGGDQVRAIAATIESSQHQQIGTMRGWLTLWNRPQLPSGDPMDWMAEGHHGSAGGVPDEGGAMPGTATVDEINRLHELTGDAFDALFLELMIRHHQGGVVMAEDAARRAALPTTRRLARTMVFEQSDEITLMTGLSLALEDSR